MIDVRHNNRPSLRHECITADHHHGGPHGGHVFGGSGSHHRQCGHAHRRIRPGRAFIVQLGLFRLHAGQHDDGAHLRQVGRPVRAQAGIHHRRPAVYRRFGPVRAFPIDGAIGLLPDHPGVGGRRCDARGPDHRRGHLSLRTTRPDPGMVFIRVGTGGADRPLCRRLDDRPFLLAVDLLV